MNSDIWITGVSYRGSKLNKIKATCLDKNSENLIINTYNDSKLIGYLGNSFSITKVKRICSDIISFEAEPAKGKRVAFSID